jgi:hypothetical protein
MLNNRPLYRLRNSSYCALLVLFCQFVQPADAQTPAAPEDRRYDVELLIFKYSNPDEYGAEHWPQHWVLPDTKNSVELTNIDTKYRSDFEALGGTGSFGGMLERLDKSVRYETLSYMAWRQRGLDKEQAVNVRVRGGRKYVPQAPVIADVEFGLFEQNFQQGYDAPEVLVRKYTETPTAVGSALYELEGEVKIVLSRYLHIYTNLLLLKPVTLTPVEPAAQEGSGTAAAGSDNPGIVYSIAWADTTTPDLAVKNENAIETLHGFNIKAHRRMRSGELHHLDHPLLGILVQIKPVETAKP